MRARVGVRPQRAGGGGPWIAPALVAVGAAGACASPGSPPGGPPRVVPPRLVAVAPDTLAVGARPRNVEFTFDEVVNEASRGTGAASGTAGGATGLESLVLVSPRNGSVSVDWGRERITVRPRRGFRPNATYTVTILPGLSDLRNNVRDSGVVAVFSTGGAIAGSELRGVVFDWVNGRTAPGAVVEATGADSVPYVALADTTGRFVIPNVPAGAYQLRGAVDVNGNRSIDPREPFDSAAGTATPRAGRPVFTAPIPDSVLQAELAVPVDSARSRARPRRPAAAAAAGDTIVGVALYAFVHDTTAPRVGTVAVTDSTTLRLSFDRPLRPEQPFGPAQVRVVAADSAVVAVREVLTAAAADSIAQAAAAQAAAARAADTTARAGAQPSPAAGGPPPGTRGGIRLGRPVPPTDLVVRLGAPLRPNAIYRLTVTAVRSLSGVAGTATRTFTTPRPTPPAPTPAAPATPTPRTAPRPTQPSTPPPSAPPARGP